MGHALSAAVALVADAGERVGLGHVARCSAIAAGLRARGGQVSCHAFGAAAELSVDGIEWQPTEAPPGGARVLVLDTYTMPADEVSELAERFELVCVHDVGAPPPGARLAVSVGGVEAPPGGEALCGLAYAPLRAPFWGLPARAPSERVSRILVTTGGGALPDAAMSAAATVREAVPRETAVRVVAPAGSGAALPAGVVPVAPQPSLLDELLGADLVVSAGGQTALEAAATGAPCVALPLVENQRGNARALEAAGAALVPANDELGKAVAGLAGSAEARARLTRRAQAAVDGYGALRIAFRIERLARTV